MKVTHPESTPLSTTQKTISQSKTGEEKRWTKPAINQTGGVKPEESLAKATPESLAYACRIFEKLSEQAPEKAELFMKTLVQNLFKTKGSDKHCALRIATDNTLKELVRSGIITAGQAEHLHDSGVAVAHKIRQEKKVSTTKQQRIGSSRSASTGGTTVQAPREFLWKPVSDSTGKLAILLPPSLSNQGATVEVLSPDGTLLATGKDGGNGNGGRDHYRFDKAGSEFPAGALVKISIPGREPQLIEIENPASRVEGRA